MTQSWIISSWFYVMVTVCLLVQGNTFIIILKSNELNSDRHTPSYSRNIIYNLSIFDLTEQQKLVWYSPEDDVKMCVVKGKDEVNLTIEFHI